MQDLANDEIALAILRLEGAHRRAQEIAQVRDTSSNDGTKADEAARADLPNGEDAMREADRAALREVNDALEVAAVRIARIVADSGTPDRHRAYMQKQWLALAKIQVNVEDKLEASDSSDEGKEQP